MKATIAKKAINDPDNSMGPLGFAFAMLLADKMIDALVDGMVTPEAVRELIVGQPPRVGSTQEPTPSQSQRNTSNEVKMHYETYSRFVVTYRDGTDPKKELTLVWQRHGLTWMLSAVRAPTSGAFGL